MSFIDKKSCVQLVVEETLARSPCKGSTYWESKGSGVRVPSQVQCRRCEGGGGTPEDDSGHQQLARIDTVDQEARGELEGKGR